jgi:hypothetical protein
MLKSKKMLFTALILLTLSFTIPQTALTQKSDKKKESSAIPVLWLDPGDIASRDLRYGPGAPDLAPTAPFTFVKEDKSGESPKFDVKDARDVEWRVKLGPEAKSETVATRLVWSVGYFAEEAYYLAEAQIENLPRLSRGREYVTSGGIVRGARFEPRRTGVERGPTWGWNKNPFEESRALNGLKVLMILLNNYDARPENNRIFYVDSRGGREARHVVSDLGATLGRAGGLGGKRTKNNLEDFLSTKFVRGVDEGVVEFDYDTRPRGFGHLSVLHPTYYRSQVKKEKSMRGIPVEHARWIGSLLSQLTDEQLAEAFRAADYDETTLKGYVRAMRERIDQLAKL